jgi:uncharacterized protein (DUF58 family)
MTPGDYRHQPASWLAADPQRLRVISSRLVTGRFAGEYRSAFRGRGIEFEEVREYQPGDDVRGIDWNVTARSGRPFVKQYAEEREMTVMLLLDRSASLAWPSPSGAKGRTAAEICALLAYAAMRSNDRVGLLGFSDRIEHYLPPAKGTRHVQRLVSELGRPPRGRGSDLAGALDYLARVQRRLSILVIVSDFLASDFRLPLIAAARRHDVVAIAPVDPLDEQLPNAGLLDLADPETGARRLTDSGNARVRAAWAAHATRRREELKALFAGVGVEHLRVATDTPPVDALTRFFLDRQRRCVPSPRHVSR